MDNKIATLYPAAELLFKNLNHLQLSTMVKAIPHCLSNIEVQPVSPTAHMPRWTKKGDPKYFFPSANASTTITAWKDSTRAI